MELVPFPEEITQLFLDKFNMMIVAMFKGTFIIAFVQGAAMGVVLWIAGVPYTMFLTILSMFLSLVPLVGISLIAWPVAIILLLTGQIWQGIFVIVAFLLVIANIDTVLSEKGEPIPKWANLRGPREVVHHLREMGIDVVTVANNHAMDFRAEGMLDMLAAYDEAGLKAIGAGENLEAATAPVVLTVGERKVAILSFSCLLPIASAAGPTWPGIAPASVVVSSTVIVKMSGQQSSYSHSPPVE